MNKFITRAAALVLCAAVAFAAVGCGAASSASSGAASSAPTVQASFGSYTQFDYENFEYSKGQTETGMWEGVTAADLVTLPEDFAAIPIPAADVVPTDEEVEEYLNQLLLSTATAVQVTDRAAVNGDTVNINYVGKVNGVAFMGGEAVGYDLTLGSGVFLSAYGNTKGFEEQIVGHSPGETFDITVTFPEGYGDSTDAEGNVITLSGSEAVFTITINYIVETVVPELTDEWVQTNLTPYYAITKASEVRDLLRREMQYENTANYVVNYLMANSTFGEIPAVILDYEVCGCLDYYASYSQYYGTDLVGFVTGVIGLESVDALLAESEETILLYCQEDMMYQALAERLGITLSPEELAQYESYVSYYGYNYVVRQAVIEKVVRVLVDGVVLVD